MNDPESAPAPPTCQGPNSDLTSPEYVAPPGACDCHLHIIGSPEIYPYVPNRSYTPVQASVADYRRVMAALRIKRAVVVQPSFYGTDNRCTHDAVASTGGAWRGVAVLNPSTKESEIAALHQAGFRGVRINLVFRGGVGTDVLEQMAQLVQPFGWHLQLLVDGRDLPALAPRLRRLKVPYVIDHMGHMPMSLGLGHPAFQTLLQLVREDGWVKLSGPYRISGELYPYADVVPWARALVEAAPSRMVWGSDWPHASVTTPIPSVGQLFDLIPLWIPDEATRQRMLVDNPAVLYGFAAARSIVDRGEQVNSRAGERVSK